MKAIHNQWHPRQRPTVLFQTTKIQIFESNSQPPVPSTSVTVSCFRLQRYKFLKAIHNLRIYSDIGIKVVSDYKDTNFWKQFTTSTYNKCNTRRLFQTTKIQIFESNSQLCRFLYRQRSCCFRLQRYKFLKAIHNCWQWYYWWRYVVSDYKDTNFWKQFTTKRSCRPPVGALFQTTKIQIFESNSQRYLLTKMQLNSCFRLQRYKFLKAIHNIYQYLYPRRFVVSDYKDTNFWKQFTTLWIKIKISKKLFQTTKIQIFESNSQLVRKKNISARCCFRLQRYKFLKAIHNYSLASALPISVVSDYKDTNFWKQFTTVAPYILGEYALFQTTKIQIFESNSQLLLLISWVSMRCFRLQRYKFLKAIHNCCSLYLGWVCVVSDYKDTNFWKQFTTSVRGIVAGMLLFQTTKIQIFESNSQRWTMRYRLEFVVSDYKDTNFWKQFTTARMSSLLPSPLFQTTKIQIFESNSQHDFELAKW